LEPEQDFDATLKRLHEEHVRFWQRNPNRARPSVSSTTLPSFPKWFVGGRAEWKLGWYVEDAKPPKDAVDEFEQETGSRKFATFLACSQRSDLTAGVFTLSFCVREDADVTKIKSLEWWAPKTAVRSKNKLWKDWPWIWFAQLRVPVGARPPFRYDTRFKNALAETIDECGGIRWLQTASLKPTKLFLDRLYRNYESNVGGSRL